MGSPLTCLVEPERINTECCISSTVLTVAYHQCAALYIITAKEYSLRLVIYTLKRDDIRLRRWYTTAFAVDKKIQVRRLGSFGGAEENRTPVRKDFDRTFSGCSLSFSSASHDRRQTGCHDRELFSVWPLQKLTGGAHLPLNDAGRRPWSSTARRAALRQRQQLTLPMLRYR